MVVFCVCTYVRMCMCSHSCILVCVPMHIPDRYIHTFIVTQVHVDVCSYTSISRYKYHTCMYSCAYIEKSVKDFNYSCHHTLREKVERGKVSFLDDFWSTEYDKFTQRTLSIYLRVNVLHVYTCAGPVGNIYMLCMNTLACIYTYMYAYAYIYLHTLMLLNDTM